MKFTKNTTNKMAIEQIRGKLHEQVETIESHKDIIYRIQFKNLEVPAYLVLDEGTSHLKAIHYCEQNEKGMMCAHLNVLGFIAAELKLTLLTVSAKNSLNEISSYPFPADDYENINRAFGLFQSVEIEEEEDVSPTTSPSVTTAPTKIDRHKMKDWKEITDYLNQEGVSPSLIYKVEQKRKAISTTVSLLPMMAAPKKPSFPYSGPMLARALRHVMLGKDLLLVGGKGTGKDTLINTISWILNLPVTINVGSKDETKESIVGEPAFRDGQSTFDLSLFAKTVQHGGIANMAEINMMMGDVTSVYHSLLDDNAVLPTPIGAIPRNEHFIMMGSMNVGEGYVGVRSLNDAFKDRFAVLRLPYTQKFEDMIRSKTGLHDSAGLIFLQNVKDAVDLLIQEETQGFAASTIRGYIDAANYFLEIGINAESKQDVIEDYILNKVEDTDEYMSLRDMIRSHAWSALPVTDEEQNYMDGNV